MTYPKSSASCNSSLAYHVVVNGPIMMEPSKQIQGLELGLSSVHGIFSCLELLITIFWWMLFTGLNSKRNL
jgi:hypothetical protein